MKTLKKIDQYLGRIDKKISLLSRINPTNANAEKRKFVYSYIKGRAYNPAFRYNNSKIDLKKLGKELNLLSIHIPAQKDEQWFFRQHLEKKRKRIVKKIRCIQCIGSEIFAKRSLRLFGTPSASQIKYAKSQFSTEACSAFTKVFDTLSDVETAKILQRHTTSHLLPWKVKLRRNISSKAGLDSRSKYLLVKKGERFSPEEVASLSIHEIETHVFRKENGALQRFPFLFGEGFAGPPTTEEGLAFFNEMQTGHDPRRMLIVAARTIACHLARKKSFYDVFRKVHTLGLPIPHAWNVTLRVKRGISDTALPGVFSKDQHYLKGYMDVKTFHEKGGDVRLLYTGKINIANAESLVKFGIEVREPRYLPKHFQ